jgi:predicted CxxxxCH...CXXCH cytochrome family protein
LLAGLILNVSAQALPGAEKSHLHSFRPFFAQQKSASRSIHPAARMRTFQKPANIANPTAYGDPGGLFCTRCHGVESGQKSTVSLQPAPRHRETALSLECASCHAQASAANRCIVLNKIAQVSGDSTKSKMLSVSPC